MNCNGIYRGRRGALRLLLAAYRKQDGDRVNHCGCAWEARNEYIICCSVLPKANISCQITAKLKRFPVVTVYNSSVLFTCGRLIISRRRFQTIAFFQTTTNQLELAIRSSSIPRRIQNDLSELFSSIEGFK